VLFKPGAGPTATVLDGHGDGVQSGAELRRRALEGIQVLLVDDDEDLRFAIAGALALHGARVECASSVSEARNWLRNEQFDAVLSDINMPGENGLEFLRSLRAGCDANSLLPAAAITSCLSAQEIEDAGFDLTIPKPFEVDFLVSSVMRLVELRRRS
jgi:DNA-binding response OmpR family regulator